MPAIAQIVIADNVPTNHTFDPISASVGSSRWITDNAATYAGNETIEIKMSQPTSTRRTSRVTALYARPIEVLDGGITVVNDVARANMEFVIPEMMTAAQALTFYTLVKNLLAHATLQSYIASRKPAF